MQIKNAGWRERRNGNTTHQSVNAALPGQTQRAYDTAPLETASEQAMTPTEIGAPG